METPTSSENLLNDLKAKAEGEAMPAVEAEQEEKQPSELDLLKQRARMMGITFSNNISAETLRAKIKAKMEGEAEPKEEAKAQEEPKELTQAELRKKLYEEQMKLVRLRITNLNPAKKDLPGEIITFANRLLGTVRKYVPFGEATENGYHVPYCIYQILKEREFVNIRTRKDSRGREIVETGMAREFALEVLPPLTPEELERLRAAQLMAGSVD